jgi:hypothetical protein
MAHAILQKTQLKFTVLISSFGIQVVISDNHGELIVMYAFYCHCSDFKLLLNKISFSMPITIMQSFMMGMIPPPCQIPNAEGAGGPDPGPEHPRPATRI